MAAEIGPPVPPVSGGDTPLDQELFRAGYRFEFFQAVRLLERLYTERASQEESDLPLESSRGQRVPLGRHEDPRDEVVRIRQRQSLAFPASDIYDVTAADDADPDTRDVMWVNFMGLGGVSGPLPRHLTSLLADPALKHQTAALREFLDVFNHRLVSLFYRAWEKYRFPIAYERGGEDTFSHYLYCLIGLGTKGLRGRLHIDDQILIYYTGLLAQRPRSAVALEGILEDYFGVPIEVVQFRGQWFEMNADLLTRPGTDGQNHQLGVNAVLWERIWDPQARFRINVGPLSYAEFCAFLPESSGHAHLIELTRFFVGDDVNFEVRPILRPKEVPWCALSTDPSIRLGWSMWLKERDLDEHMPQPVFEARVATG
jgi:type VI secretion system protein ImpH